jgi:hypothetical protein
VARTRHHHAKRTRTIDSSPRQLISDRIDQDDESVGDRLLRYPIYEFSAYDLSIERL